ncbi:MAG: head-tail joining protein [Pontibacterium sp.]
MSVWLELEAELDDAILDEFSERVILHLPAGDLSVLGVFEAEDEAISVRDGGFIRDSDASLLISNQDAMGLETRALLSIRGKQWIVVKPPVADGINTTKLLLGAYDGNQSGQPDIRY